jgi:glucose/arabinose dehydrogenase
MWKLAAGAMVVDVTVLAACGGDDAATTPAPSATKPAPVGSPSAAPSAPAKLPELSLKPVASGFSRPTLVTNAGDGSNRLFVLEKPGRIRIIEGGSTLPTPFLDIRSLIRSTGNEQGLLGLAFHPDFAANGRFFVAYTATDAKNTVAEYQVTQGGSDAADPSTGTVLFAQADQYPNHNGGMLAFGADGYLYISMGDGGSGGDPDGNGQNLGSLLGKLLRIDVDSGAPYGIPPGNPFTADGQRPEIWSYGLRNPWRFSFDRETGDIWIADVGQGKYEEIDFEAAGSKGGANYGWNVMEGAHCYAPADCKQDGYEKPVFEYTHDEGCSVTGGYVYRGKDIAGLAGAYLFTDYCSGKLWATTRTAGGGFDTKRAGQLPDDVSAFGEDEAGELYVAVDSEGAIYKVAAK